MFPKDVTSSYRFELLRYRRLLFESLIFKKTFNMYGLCHNASFPRRLPSGTNLSLLISDGESPHISVCGSRRLYHNISITYMVKNSPVFSYAWWISFGLSIISNHPAFKSLHTASKVSLYLGGERWSSWWNFGNSLILWLRRSLFSWDVVTVFHLILGT
jgi:hypothetical protein